MLKFNELISGLKQRKILPLYLFFGEEEFLIREALDLIVKAVVDPGASDFNFNVLYCRDTPASEVVNLAQTLPFMSEKRLVIAKEIEAWKAGDLNELQSYLDDPSPNTCLALVSNQPRFDKKAVLSAVESHGAVVRFYPLLDREIVGWINIWARGRGLTLQAEAAQYLWQTIGNDLQALDNELQKAEIFIRGKKVITVDDMKAVVGDFREYTSFDLAAAVGQKNRERAFLILTRLLQEGEQPVGLLGAIAWNFRRLLQAKSLEAAGLGPDEIVKKLKIVFHQTGQFREQMRRYRQDELRHALSILLSTDRALKSSGLNGKLVLERMVLRLCGS